jgi:hypothetical protein
MKAYLVIYPGDPVSNSGIRDAMDKFRLVEHLSEKTSVILSFRSEDEILEVLNEQNRGFAPIFVIKIPSAVYTSHVPADYMEPHSAEHL